MVKLSLGGAAGGGITGASVGSAFGPIGAAAGGVVGAVAGLFGSKKKKRKKIKTLDPQQEGVYNDYVASLRGQGPFSDLYNFDAQGYNNVFDQTVGRPAYRNFQENIIPGITGQYRQGNLMNSSYSGEALSRAGRDVQENLDAQRSANIFAGQQQANQNKMSGIQNVLNMKTFDYQQPGQSSIDQILNKVGPAAGEWFADYLKDRRQSMATKPTAPAV